MSLQTTGTGKAANQRLVALEAEARYARERYQLYRARAYGPRATSPARLRELERAWKLAESRLNRSRDSADSGPWGGATVRLSTAGGLMLVDVEGELQAPDVTRWRDLLNSAITGATRGVAVDLRGCRAIDIGCLSVLVAASGKLKGRGDGGIKLVTTPGSPLERSVRATAAKGLDGHSSAGEALRSLRDAGLIQRAR